VEATCNRILVIAHGRLVADGTVESLTSLEGAGTITLKIAGPASGEQARAELQRVAGVKRVEPVDGNGTAAFRIDAERDARVEEALFDLAVKNRWKILELHREPATLETVFRHKTRGEPVHA
jgi:ABC-2 type transport system ATP-binding protein